MDKPPDPIPVPRDIPARMTVRGPDGEERIDARREYAAGYERGWRVCAEDRRAGRLDLREQPEDYQVLGAWDVYSWGCNAGYRACWGAIRTGSA